MIKPNVKKTELYRKDCASSATFAADTSTMSPSSPAGLMTTDKAVTLLSETLKEEEATDAALTELAESVINAEAQEEAEVG
jgi:Domain of unknown function (DUF892)